MFHVNKNNVLLVNSIINNVMPVPMDLDSRLLKSMELHFLDVNIAKIFNVPIVRKTIKFVHNAKSVLVYQH